MRDVYLLLSDPKVLGESQDGKHINWIEIENFDHAIHQGVSATASTAGGHPIGRATHDAITIEKAIDMSSPVLKQYCSGGQTFKTSKFEFFRADGEGQRVKLYEINLRNVVITDIIYSTGGDGLIRERISMVYSAIEWKYTKQKIAGNQEGNTGGAWNLNRNSTEYSA
ncbi:MAG: type VI secretion system tube protein Hcp [Burkholderiales bacterium]|jgi:type VI secretion system secreted protein Hcp|nr:type VI secretion system tube protein Hcp [Burkholderiales bacterium]